MKNATYVDQSDTIRTLTEEEMTVVSGGFNLDHDVWVYQHTNWTPSYYNNYYNNYNNYYSSNALNFLENVYSNSSAFANAGCIFFAIQNE